MGIANPHRMPGRRTWRSVTVDWRDRFRAPIVSAASVARDNTARGVVITDTNERFQAYAWDRSAGSLQQLTRSEAAVTSAVISPDGRYVYAMVEEEPGTELGHIHRFPFDGSEPTDLTPDLDPYPIFGFEATSTGVIGIGAADGFPSLVVVVDGEVTIRPMPGLVIGFALSEKEGLAAVSMTTPGKGLVPTMRIIDLSTGEVVSEHPDTSGGAIHGSRVAAAVVDGDWMRPAILQDGFIDPIDVDIPGDVTPIDWSADGTTILLQQSYRSAGGLHLFDVATGETVRLASPDGAQHPAAPASLVDERTAITIWSDANTPWRAIEVSPDGWRVAVAVGEVDEFPGPRWEEFTFQSTGGATIQGWLLKPEGDGPWPTVLYTHGGPSSVAGPSFSPIAGAWFDAGYAVASINYRGSTTFGESFREVLTANIGGPDVDDVVAARQWLVEQGIGDPNHIVKNGYSYGGYLTLQSLGTHPELWAAGVAGAPVADWAISYEDVNDVLRGYELSLFGGPPDENPELYSAASPRTYAAHYQAPVLITQPENDSRTPIRPVRMFVDDLEANGKQVELILLKGGHAGSGKEQTIEMVESWLDFVDRVAPSRPESPPPRR